MRRFILVLSVISILFLAGCSLNKNDSNNISGDVDNQQQEVVDNNVDESNIDESIEDEYSLARSRGTVKTVLENETVVVRSIEFLNSDGGLAHYAPGDEELENLYYKYNGQINLRDVNGKTLVEVFGVSFELCSLKDNILSIVLLIVDIPISYYEICNIDIESKEILNNEDIIRIAGRNLEKLRGEVQQIEYKLTKETCDKMISNYPEPDEYITELYKNELKEVEENFDFTKVEFYFNESGNLSFNSSMYSGAIAGIGVIDYLYDIDLNKVIIQDTVF